MAAAGASSGSGEENEATLAFINCAEEENQGEVLSEERGEEEEAGKPERGTRQKSPPQTAYNAVQAAGSLEEKKQPIEQTPEGEMKAERNAPCFFACRRCRRLLFVETNVLHDTSDQIEQASAGGTETAPSNHPVKNCTSVFIEPLEWMEGLDSQQGRLHCPNPSCQGKLGSWSWHGLRCSCGKWQVPAFQVHLSRVDRLPAILQGNDIVPSAVF